MCKYEGQRMTVDSFPTLPPFPESWGSNPGCQACIAKRPYLPSHLTRPSSLNSLTSHGKKSSFCRSEAVCSLLKLLSGQCNTAACCSRTFPQYTFQPMQSFTLNRDLRSVCGALQCSWSPVKLRMPTCSYTNTSTALCAVSVTSPLLAS